MSYTPQVDVTVKGQNKDDSYRLKVSFPELGMHPAEGWRAQKSEIDPSGWYIQPAAYPAGSKWKKTVEFDRNHPFWHQIKTACISAIEAYEAYSANETNKATDEYIAYPELDELTDKAIERELDEAQRRLEATSENRAIPWLEDES